MDDPNSSSLKTLTATGKDRNAHLKAGPGSDMHSADSGNEWDSLQGQEGFHSTEDRQNAFANSCETPREVDLFGEDNIEEILEMMDNLRASMEQLQVYCAKLAMEKSKLEQTFIDKERDHLATIERYQQELLTLRKANLQLRQDAQKSAHEMGDPPEWFEEALNTEQVQSEKIEAVAKSESLRLTVMEKDKIISDLEWQVTDCEATITSLQAERDKIAFELDYNLAREQEEFEVFGAVGELDRCRYDSQSRLPASYTDSPQHSRKPPQRHYSDLTNKSEVVEGPASASWLDEPQSEGDFGAGRLKRTTNFNNINDLDESENYDEDDSNSMLSDHVSTSERALHQVPEPTPLSKINRNKWQSFGSDSGEWQDGGRARSTVVRASSAVSDLCAWQSLSGHKELPQSPLLTRDNPRKDILSHRSLSVGHSNSTDEGQSDLWSFTPDSILNVTTGEEISKSEPQSPSNALLMALVPTQNENNAEFTEKHELHNEFGQDRSGTLTDEDTNLECIEMAPDTAKRKQVANGAKQSQRILEEYQKWKVTGRKGDPPAKLKISQ